VGRATLDLPLREPGGLRYEARVDALEMDLGGEGTTATPFAVSGDRDTLAIRGLDLRSGHSRFQVDGQLGLAADTPSPLVVHGDVPLAEVAFFLPDAELEGEATVDLLIGAGSPIPRSREKSASRAGPATSARWSCRA
jgi:hypothetical protein